MLPHDVTGGEGDVLRPTNVDPIRHGCCHTPFLFSFVPILSFGKTKQKNNTSSMQKVSGVLSLDSHRTKSCCHTAVSVSFNQILFLVCGCCRWRVWGGQVGSSRTKVSRTQTAGPMAGWVLRTTPPHPTLLILITWLFCCYFIHIMSQKRREICRVTLCLLFGWNCLFWAKGGRLFEPPDKEVPRRRCCCRFLFIFLMFFLVFSARDLGLWKQEHLSLDGSAN